MADKLESKKEESKTTKSTSLKLKIFNPFKTFYEGQCQSISAVNDTGPFDILPGHHNFISLIKAGKITVRDSQGEQTFDVSKGVMHVQKDAVTVFLDV
jgi:F-type H+-transporting ATPase subunit epsilon